MLWRVPPSVSGNPARESEELYSTGGRSGSSSLWSTTGFNPRG